MNCDTSTDLIKTISRYGNLKMKFIKPIQAERRSLYEDSMKMLITNVINDNQIKSKQLTFYFSNQIFLMILPTSITLITIMSNGHFQF